MLAMMGIKDNRTRLQQKTGTEGKAHGFRKCSRVIVISGELWGEKTAESLD